MLTYKAPSLHFSHTNHLQYVNYVFRYKALSIAMYQLQHFKLEFAGTLYRKHSRLPVKSWEE